MRETYLSKQYSKFSTSKLFGDGSTSKADNSFLDKTTSIKLNETSLLKDNGDSSLQDGGLPAIKRNKSNT